MRELALSTTYSAIGLGALLVMSLPVAVVSAFLYVRRHADVGANPWRLTAPDGAAVGLPASVTMLLPTVEPLDVAVARRQSEMDALDAMTNMPVPIVRGRHRV